MNLSVNEKIKKIIIIEHLKFRLKMYNVGAVICKSYFKCENNFNIIEQYNDHNHYKPEDKLLNRQKNCSTLKRTAKEIIS